MESLLTAHLLLAVTGGIVGGFRSALREHPPRSWRVRVVDFMIGVVVAASVSHLVPPQMPMMALAYGVLAGTLAAYALDIAYDFVPHVVRAIINIRLNIKDKNNE